MLFRKVGSTDFAIGLCYQFLDVHWAEHLPPPFQNLPLWHSRISPTLLATSHMPNLAKKKYFAFIHLGKKENNFLERKTAWNRYFYLCILFFSSRFPHFLLFPASSCGLLRLPHRSLFHSSAEELFRRSANFGKALPPKNGKEIGEVNVGDRS